MVNSAVCVLRLGATPPVPGRLQSSFPMRFTTSESYSGGSTCTWAAPLSPQRLHVKCLAMLPIDPVPQLRANSMAERDRVNPHARHLMLTVALKRTTSAPVRISFVDIPHC